MVTRGNPTASRAALVGAALDGIRDTQTISSPITLITFVKYKCLVGPGLLSRGQSHSAQPDLADQQASAHAQALAECDSEPTGKMS
jgi:hypothetical protein